MPVHLGIVGDHPGDLFELVPVRTRFPGKSLSKELLRIDHRSSDRSEPSRPSHFTSIFGILSIRRLWISGASENLTPRIADHFQMNFWRDSAITFPALISGAVANVADHR